MTRSNNPEWTRQIALNQASREHWPAFAEHRRKLTELLLADAGRQAGRLCVLGSGNCNDVDLRALLRVYREVHLVDLDANALRAGAARQGAEDQPGLRLWGRIDLTGMGQVTADWSPRSLIGADDERALADAPARLVAPALPGSFDRVASTCVLRPIIASLFHAVGDRHARFPELVRSIRAGHLRLMARLLAAGGRGVLVTDLVSSDTLPDLAALHDSVLPGVLAQLEPTGNFFHGVRPSELAGAFQTDPELRAQLSRVRPLPPWRWRLHGRVYLVWALGFERLG